MLGKVFHLVKRQHLDMTTQQIINVIGMTFDIIGVLMLFKYGLPSDLNKHGTIFKVAEGFDQREVDQWKRYDRLSKIALTFIIIGFLMQVLSTVWVNITATP